MNEPYSTFQGEEHFHECLDCHDTWIHDAIDEGCEGVTRRLCPIHEYDDPDLEPWYVRRERVG